MAKPLTFNLGVTEQELETTINIQSTDFNEDEIDW